MEGGFPMFFDVDGRGTDIFPTGMYLFIYFFWEGEGERGLGSVTFVF